VGSGELLLLLRLPYSSSVSEAMLVLSAPAAARCTAQVIGKGATLSQAACPWVPAVAVDSPLRLFQTTGKSTTFVYNVGMHVRAGVIVLEEVEHASHDLRKPLCSLPP
jgi:hypothetical protein